MNFISESRRLSLLRPARLPAGEPRIGLVSILRKSTQLRDPENNNKYPGASRGLVSSGERARERERDWTVGRRVSQVWLLDCLWYGQSTGLREQDIRQGQLQLMIYFRYLDTI